jgi:hypothetical protein
MSDDGNPRANINLPPLSTTRSLKYRRSNSFTYPKTTPEVKFRPTPLLPELWIRDAREMSASTAAELQDAWIRYLELGIPGDGDGKGGKYVYSKKARRRLEEEYAGLEEGVRRAKEVALARWEGFCLRRDGTLDYYTGEGDGDRCGVM